MKTIFGEAIGHHIINLFTLTFGDAAAQAKVDMSRAFHIPAFAIFAVKSELSAPQSRVMTRSFRPVMAQLFEMSVKSSITKN